jgi:hypothetical protein
MDPSASIDAGWRMSGNRSSAAWPATPIVLFDDDDVMLTFSSSHEAEFAIEWPLR